MTTAAPRVVYCGVDQLEFHPKNIGKNRYPDEVQERMGRSILSGKGVKCALQIVPSDKRGIYWVEEGNLRLSGARWIVRNGKKCPPLKCELSGDSEKEQIVTMLVTATNRYSKDVVSMAEGYQQLHTKFRMSYDEIAERMGEKHRYRIENTLLWLQLDEPIRELARNRKLQGDPRVCTALLEIPDTEARIALARKCASEGLTINAVIRAAKNVTDKIRGGAKARRCKVIELAKAKARKKELSRAKIIRKADLEEIAHAACKVCLAGKEIITKYPEPAYILIRHAAAQTCESCELLDLENACKECPMVEFFKRLLGLNHGKQKH